MYSVKGVALNAELTENVKPDTPVQLTAYTFSIF